MYGLGQGCKLATDAQGDPVDLDQHLASFLVLLGALGGGSCACCGLLILLLGLILAFTMKEEVPTSYKVDAEGKIILDHSGTGGSPESMQNSDGPDGPGVGSSEDTDAWYKEN